MSIDNDELAGRLRALADEAAIRWRQEIENAQRPRAHGTPRNQQVFWTGYVNGVCSALAIVTGESSEELIHSYQGELIR